MLSSNLPPPALSRSSPLLVKALNSRAKQKLAESSRNYGSQSRPAELNERPGPDPEERGGAGLVSPEHGKLGEGDQGEGQGG